jgi:DNA-directed RNA polymerase
MLSVWEAGGGIAGIPPRANLPVPVLSLLQSSQNSASEAESSKSKFQALKQLKSVMKHNAELHSLRTDFLYKIETARVFRNHEFYFPHNVDFRGRAYPMPIHLHHLGSDVCRGLLRFAEKKPLQVRGLFWLKVHLANLFGKNKMNFNGRVQWTENNRDNVLSAADDPLGPAKAWWLEADEPWQALAVCFELAQVSAQQALPSSCYDRDSTPAQAYRSPCPEEYMTGVPVHMDGSCNGLQHYAALGRDVAGAAEVNLINAEQPSDPYRSVAERLQVIMDGMSRDESNPQQQQLARFLTSRIGRKVVKQTVMTSVYGVTFIGARAQIHRQLVDLTRGEAGVTEEMLFKCSSLLARETLIALAQTFSGAKAVMTWLARVASFVAKKTGKPITWVTPLGLPVLQPYRSSGSYQVKTCLQHVVLARDTDHLPVNSRKQSTAFAPNFIHSIDSTHLLMTASDCAARGLTFAGDRFDLRAAASIRVQSPHLPCTREQQ